MFNGAQPENEQEKQMKILTQQAKDEDAFFLETGIEVDILNFMVIKSEIHRDAEFI